MSEAILLKPEQARAKLGFSRSKLFRLLRNGDVASVTVGSTRYIPIAEIERLRTLSKVTLRPVGVQVGNDKSEDVKK